MLKQPDLVSFVSVPVNASAGDAPTSKTVAPSGRFAYIADVGFDDESIFSINPFTGALTALGMSVIAGTDPHAITIYGGSR
jgi:6-phosphogluconolactonase (cycloisomerase 2 family)